MPLNTFTEQINGLSVDRSVIAQVVTLEDNLTHPYITSVDISKDNVAPIGIAKFHIVYDQQIIDYWVKYNGVVVVSFNIKDLNRENTNSLNFSESHQLNNRLQNEQYNYSFICKVSRVKQKGKEIIILLEDLGWKFMQKVPVEFRNTYISNQYLDDAFQAICEFLDVQFAYSIEDLHKFQFGADGYSITKDGAVIDVVQTILDEEPTTSEEPEDPLDDPIFEDQALMDLLKGKSQDEQTQQSKNDSTLSSSTDADLDNKTQEHQEDFDKKILDLFIGNAYYESDLINPVLDYNKITITPTSNTNTTLSNTDSTTPEETTDQQDDQTQGTANTKMHEATQKTFLGATEVFKAVLANPKATKAIGNFLFGTNTSKKSVASFLKDASKDKEKQKLFVKALKDYARNPK